MDTIQIIGDWLKRFDAIIDRVAVDPASVKTNDSLRHAFEAAFPPEALPDELVFKAEGELSQFDDILKMHRPYYIAKPTQTTRTNTRTGATKVTSKLVLRLRNSEDLRSILRKRGLLHSSVKAARVKARGVHDPYVKIVKTLEEIVSSLEDSTLQLEARVAQARQHGNSRSLQLYEDQLRKTKENLQTFQGELADSEKHLFHG